AINASSGLLRPRWQSKLKPCETTTATHAQAVRDNGGDASSGSARLQQHDGELLW
ncbi:hypothetical protein PanWU01x14_181230, partial [Parasponia andersonii]